MGLDRELRPELEMQDHYRNFIHSCLFHHDDICIYTAHSRIVHFYILNSRCCTSVLCFICSPCFLLLYFFVMCQTQKANSLLVENLRGNKFHDINN